MTSSSIGSSMEAHISHFIAYTFASRPKGYSENNISKYFMLNDAKINGINLFNTYLQTYNRIEKKSLYEESNSSFTNKRDELPTVTLPYLQNSNSSPTYNALANLSCIDSEIKV